jgi:hypothetical protein
MARTQGVKAGLAATLFLLAACGGDGEPRLMNLRSTTAGPDEFGIVPPRALELPEDLAALPEPTPGGSNRTDQRPLDDAVAALGGVPGAGSTIPSGDAGLYNYAARFGIAPDIRQTLAAEDLEWRRDNNGRVLERLFNVNVYYKAYRRQSLNQQEELLFWRKRGVRTSSAPPAKDGEE